LHFEFWRPGPEFRVVAGGPLLYTAPVVAMQGDEKVNMAIVMRALHILVQPNSEWPMIKQERTDLKTLYLEYVAILAAIPVVAGFIGNAFVGTLSAGRASVGNAFGAAVLGYVFSLIMVFVVALVADSLAPTFGGRKNIDRALKLVAYSMTASWVAGAFAFIPVLGWLISLLGGLYTLYLFYLGAPVLMKTPESKTIGYTAVTVAIAIVLGFVMGMISVAIFGVAGMLGGMGRL
jgi:Yip1 domain